MEYSSSAAAISLAMLLGSYLLWKLQVHCPCKCNEGACELKVPLLVVGAGKDSVNPPQESICLFERANEPKSLMMLDEATHYELYEGNYLDTVSSRQIAWFAQYL